MPTTPSIKKTTKKVDTESTTRHKNITTTKPTATTTTKPKHRNWTRTCPRVVGMLELVEWDEGEIEKLDEEEKEHLRRFKKYFCMECGFYCCLVHNDECAQCERKMEWRVFHNYTGLGVKRFWTNPDDGVTYHSGWEHFWCTVCQHDNHLSNSYMCPRCPKP